MFRWSICDAKFRSGTHGLNEALDRHSPRDRSSISQPVAHFCGDQETEMSSKEEEEGSGNHHNWPGTN